MDSIDVLEQQAIDAAINSQWGTAVELNKQILKIEESNVDSCLRLGFAYMQLKKNAEAKKFYNKVLRIQPRNQVALENLERLKIMGLRDSVSHIGVDAHLDPNLFLEVPGRTKSVSLVNLGQKKMLASLTVGQEVELKGKKRRVEVRTVKGEYIGSLPDDLSKRLISFLKAKSAYRSFVQEATLARILIFIQEIKKGSRVANYISFPANIQTNLEQLDQQLQKDVDDASEPEEEEATENELETLAENLTDKEEPLVDITEREDQDEAESEE